MHSSSMYTARLLTVARGEACVAGGMWQGVCMARGHVARGAYGKGACGKGGMHGGGGVEGGMHGGCAWQGEWGCTI